MRNTILSGAATLLLPLVVLGAHPARSLAQQDAFSLQGLVVTASPTPRDAASVAANVTVLSGDALRADGVTSVAEALRSVAGVDIVRQGSFGGITALFVRGGESDHTLVLVDGVQVNQAGGGYDLAALTTDNVERIEVLRGPASALYGSDAMAGVIHIVTRTGRGAPRITVRAETSFYSEPRHETVDGVRLSADVAGGNDRFGYSGSISHEKQEGILAFNNRFLNTVGTANAQFSPDDRTRIAVTLRATDREFHYPTDGSGQVVDANAYGFGDEMLARLLMARRLDDVFEVEASISVNETDGGTEDAFDDPSDTEAYHSLDHFRRATGQVRATATVGSAIMTLGGEIEQERQRSFSESHFFGVSYGRSQSERENWAGFAHVAGDQGHLSWNAGARVEDNQRFGTSGTYQVGLAARVPDMPGTRFRASFGTGIKEPTFYENFAADGFSVGNPDLDPEKSLTWEVGAEHHFTDEVRFEATYYDSKIENLIQYVWPSPAGAPGGTNFLNVAEASSRGIEVGVGASVGTVDGGVSYSWLDTEVVEAGFDSGAGALFVEGEALLRRPTHTLALHAAAMLGARARLFGRVSYVGTRDDRYFDAAFTPTRTELESYTLVTLGTEWRVADAVGRRPGLSISLRAENLLDAEYEEVYAFATPGRQIYLGFSLGYGGAN